MRREWLRAGCCCCRRCCCSRCSRTTRPSRRCGQLFLHAAGRAPGGLRRPRQLRARSSTTRSSGRRCATTWLRRWRRSRPRSCSRWLMALAVNGALPGRALPAPRLFHADHPADDRGGEHLAVLLHARLRAARPARSGCSAWTAQLARHATTALPAMIVVAVWKEAGFFMIFYLAALQSLPPHLARGGRARGRVALVFLPPRDLPLLMPTTLFVLVNAVINAFRLVDHIVVMTRGGPDNATTLLLYYIYEIGFRFWDSAYAAALTVVLLAILGIVAVRCSSACSSGGCITDDTMPCRAADACSHHAAAARWRRSAPGCSACSGSCRCSTRSGPRSIRRTSRRASSLVRAAHARQLRQRMARRTVRPLLLNTFLLVTLVLVAQFVLCTPAAYAFARFEFPGRDVAVRAGAAAADGHARRADRRELSHHARARAGATRSSPSRCPILARRSAFSCCARRSVRCRASSTTRLASKAARRCSGCGRSMCRWRGRPISPMALVLVSYHWNNFLWPLIITNSVSRGR